MFIKKYYIFFAGALAGFINGLLGAGGGMIAVPALKKSGLSEKESHATSVAVILPISAISSAIYFSKGIVGIRDILPYIPTGIIGAIVGGIFLSKFSVKTISVMFSLLLIYSGIKIIF